MGNYHPIKEIVGICAVGLIGLLGGFKTGEHKGFEKGVQSERQRLSQEFVKRVENRTRRGANYISLAEDSAQIPSYTNFFYGDFSNAQALAFRSIGNILDDKNNQSRLTKFGFIELGEAKAYRDAQDCLR